MCTGASTRAWPRGGRVAPARPAILATLLAVAFSSVALAAGDPYRDGVAALKGGRCEKAEDSFTLALKRRPDNLDARYGRGLSRSCLGEYDAAAEDLLAVAQGRPENLEVALELGAALTSAGAFREAAPWLERARRAPELDGPASLLLGLGRLRRNDLAAARRSLARARERSPELSAQAHYYAGVVEYRAGDLAAADRHFAAVVESRPGVALGREASAFRAAIRRQRRAGYQADGAVAFEYDSNVPLVPSNGQILEELGPTKKSDGRMTLTASLRAFPFPKAGPRVRVGYSFFESFHFDLREFDIQRHEPALRATGRIGPVRWMLDGRYQFFLRTEKLKSFEHQWQVRPSVKFHTPRLGETEVFYRALGRKFFDDDFDDLDGYNNAAGIRQTVPLGGRDRYLLVGYQFDRQDLENRPAAGGRGEDENPFSYDGNEVDLGAGATLAAGVHAALRYSFRHQHYSDASRSATQSDRRGDDKHSVSLLLRRRLGNSFQIMAGYMAVWNDSNRDLFTYNRHIGLLALSARY